MTNEQRARVTAGLCWLCPPPDTRPILEGTRCAFHIRERDAKIRARARVRMRAKSDSKPWRPGGPGRPPKYTEA